MNKVDSWFWLEEIEVLADSSTKGTVVTFGDSITDGFQSTPNENHRWPDYFADRIQKESPDFKLAVLNEGISGNRILTDTERFGVNALARLDEDVVLKNNVKAVIMLEGINDIGHGTFDAVKIIDGMKMIISQVHAKGIRIYGCTILPFAGAKYDTPEGQATRESVNNWIRTNSGFDGVIDFDKALRDPENLTKILPQYDSGDHLHPNDKGYQIMANTIDLHILRK
ncbi:MAG: SGNH/GDSL hydrolase family protein [Selenomonadaceae bacterium]